MVEEQLQHWAQDITSSAWGKLRCGCARWRRRAHEELARSSLVEAECKQCTCPASPPCRTHLSEQLCSWRRHCMPLKWQGWSWKNTSPCRLPWPWPYRVVVGGVAGKRSTNLTGICRDQPDKALLNLLVTTRTYSWAPLNAHVVSLSSVTMESCHGEMPFSMSLVELRWSNSRCVGCCLTCSNSDQGTHGERRRDTTMINVLLVHQWSPTMNWLWICSSDDGWPAVGWMDECCIISIWTTARYLDEEELLKLWPSHYCFHTQLSCSLTYQTQLQLVIPSLVWIICSFQNVHCQAQFDPLIISTSLVSTKPNTRKDAWHFADQGADDKAKHFGLISNAGKGGSSF